MVNLFTENGDIFDRSHIPNEAEMEQLMAGPTEKLTRFMWDTWYGPGSSVHVLTKCPISKSFEIHLSHFIERLKGFLVKRRYEKVIAELMKEAYIAKLKELNKELKNRRNIDTINNGEIVEDENGIRNVLTVWTAIDEGYTIGINEAIKAIEELNFHHVNIG